MYAVDVDNQKSNTTNVGNLCVSRIDIFQDTVFNVFIPIPCNFAFNSQYNSSSQDQCIIFYLGDFN